MSWIRAIFRAVVVIIATASMGAVLGQLLFLYPTTKLGISFWFFPKWWFFSALGIHLLSLVTMWLLRSKTQTR